MLPLLKNEGGFTLMEAIISIAALAVVSGFILQMFLVSNNVNIKANEIDHSNAIVFNAIELFKKQDSADKYIEESFFDDCSIVENDTGLTITKGYDKDFKQVALDAFDANGAAESAAFVLRVDITTGLRSSKDMPGRIDGIRAAMTGYKDGNPIEIVSIESSKYFAY